MHVVTMPDGSVEYRKIKPRGSCGGWRMQKKKVNARVGECVAREKELYAKWRRERSEGAKVESQYGSPGEGAVNSLATRPIRGACM
jgi:hypothetical protein